jgi:hypothetical protein
MNNRTIPINSFKGSTRGSKMCDAFIALYSSLNPQLPPPTGYAAKKAAGKVNYAYLLHVLCTGVCMSF